MTARIPTVLLILSSAVIFMACADGKPGGASDTGPGGGTSGGSTSDGGGGGGGGGGSGTETGEPDWEVGCITVSGFATGFAKLADAVDRAGDGATVTLCEGSIEETVAITQPLTLVGPGADLLVWNAPSNQPGVTVSATSGVSLSGFSMISTRNGVEVVGASDVTVSDIDFVAVGNTGVKVEDTTGLVVRDCSFQQPPYGAVEVSGGDATITGIQVSGAEGFGIHALSGAVVQVSDSTLVETTYSFLNDDGTVDDGFALWAESGAALSSTGDTFEDNFLGSFADEASLDISGDTYSGGNYGIYSVLGALSVSGTTITDPVLAGIYHVSTGLTPSITDTVVTGEPDVVDPDASYGVGVIADSAEISGLEIQGFNAYGLFMAPYNNTIEADISDTTLTNTGRSGLYLESADTILTQVSVIDHRLVFDPSELYDEATGSVSVAYGAVVLNGGTADWAGGAVTGSEIIGIAQLQATLNASDLLIEDNQWAGIFNFYGGLTLTGATLRGSSRYYRMTPEILFGSGGVFSYYGSTTLQSVLFEDNLVSFTDGIFTPDPQRPDATSTTTLYQSQDVWSQGSTLLKVLDSTFTNGSQSLYIDGGDEIVISGNSWSEYNAQPLYFYNVTTPVEMTDNSFENIGRYSVYGYLSDLVIDGLQVTGARDYEYTVIYNDAEGTALETQSSKYDSWEFYCDQCDLELRNATFTNNGYQSIQTYYGTVQLYDVAISGGGVTGSDSYAAVSIYDPEQAYIIGLDIADQVTGYGLNLVSYTDGAVIEVSDVSITNPPRYGLYLYGSTSYQPEISVQNLSISGAGEYGIYLSSIKGMAFDGVSVAGSGYYGAYLYNSEVSFSGTSAFSGNGMDGVYAYLSDVALTGAMTLSSNAGNGMTCYSGLLELGSALTAGGNKGAGLWLYDATALADGGSFAGNVSDGVQSSASQVNFSGVDVSNNQGYGLNLTGTDLVLIDSTVTGNTRSGIYLGDSYDLEMTGDTVTGNGGYGLECGGSVGSLTCGDNDLSDNAMGELDGCDGCGLSAGDTGL